MLYDQQKGCETSVYTDCNKLQFTVHKKSVKNYSVPCIHRSSQITLYIIYKDSKKLQCTVYTQILTNLQCTVYTQIVTNYSLQCKHIL